MSNIAIMMFTILSVALAIGIYQLTKTKRELPDDTSDIQPGRKLQKMDQDQEDKEIRGTKKNPLEA